MTDILDSLYSGKNSYESLAKLLKAGKWKDADRATLRCMNEVVKRRRGEPLSIKGIRSFPLLDLQTIDQLWTNHSQGQFGFTVQKKIWKTFYSPRHSNRDWINFMTAIGWLGPQGKKIKYQELTFNKTAPQGHLPCSIYGLQPFRDLDRFEIGKCEWFMFEALAKRLTPRKSPESAASLLSSDPPAIIPQTKSIEAKSNTIQIESPILENSLKPLTIFISYSRKDKALKEQLELHLSTMVRQNRITPWHDQEIEAGTEWDAEIKAQIETADIILLLVTADFMASNYIHNHELTQAMARHESGTARVIPIMMRPVDIEEVTFSKLPFLPQGGEPVTLWQNQDEAFQDIAQGIRQVVDSITTKSNFEH